MHEGTDLYRFAGCASIGRRWEQACASDTRREGMTGYSKDGWEGNSRRKGVELHLCIMKGGENCRCGYKRNQSECDSEAW
jgi:hypothetical protein